MESTDKKSLLSAGMHNPSWRGYTIEELRYRRAYVRIKLETQKEKLLREYSSTVKEGVLPMNGTSRGIMAKVMGALDYFDYAFIAYKAGGKLLSIMRALRPRRKKK